ncbi:hypothetical protein T484DRAFT_1777509, partial [Baffinella frigidus]
MAQSHEMDLGGGSSVSHELDLGGAGGLMRVGERGGSVMRVGRHAPPSGLSMHREHLSMR